MVPARKAITRQTRQTVDFLQRLDVRGPSNGVTDGGRLMNIQLGSLLSTIKSMGFQMVEPPYSTSSPFRPLLSTNAGLTRCTCIGTHWRRRLAISEKTGRDQPSHPVCGCDPSRHLSTSLKVYPESSPVICSPGRRISGSKAHTRGR